MNPKVNKMTAGPGGVVPQKTRQRQNKQAKQSCAASQAFVCRRLSETFKFHASLDP
jgi:hypothetical protein